MLTCNALFREIQDRLGSTYDTNLMQFLFFPDVKIWALNRTELIQQRID